jgi:hypothetical protein
MVINIINKSKLSEDSLVTESMRIDSTASGYTRYTGDRVNVVETFMRTVHDIPTSYNDGTFGPHLRKLLIHNGVKGTYGQTSLVTAMKGVTPLKPLIIRIGDPGHWVVVVKRRKRAFKDSEYTILDPGHHKVVTTIGYGVYDAPRDDRSFTQYWVSCIKAPPQKRIRVMF